MERIPVDLTGSFPDGVAAWVVEARQGNAVGVPPPTFDLTAYALCAPATLPIAAAPPTDPNQTAIDTPAQQDPNRDVQARLTAEQRRQRERTNRSGHDDEHTEGGVLEVACNDPEPSLLIANVDGPQQLILRGEARAACGSITPGNYVVATGTKENETLFYADEVDVT